MMTTNIDRDLFETIPDLGLDRNVKHEVKRDAFETLKNYPISSTLDKKLIKGVFNP